MVTKQRKIQSDIIFSSFFFLKNLKLEEYHKKQEKEPSYKMSNTTPSSKPQKARISAILMIVALIIFTIIIVLQADSLQWPLASELQNLASPHRPPLILNSTLLVSVESSTTSNTVCENFTCSVKNITSPIPGALVSLFQVRPRPILVASNITNSEGKASFTLPPNSFQVRVTNPTENLTLFLSTHSGNTTELDVDFSQTSYASSFFQLSESTSPGLVMPWDDIFVKLQSGSSFTQSSNESFFLQFVPALVLGSEFYPKISAHIVNQYATSNGATWLDVQLNSVENTTGMSRVYAINSISYYTIKEYPTTTSLAAAINMNSTASQTVS
jgi:hypothetical protein